MIEAAIYLMGMMCALVILLGLLGQIGEVFIQALFAMVTPLVKIWKSLRRVPEKIDNR